MHVCNICSGLLLEIFQPPLWHYLQKTSQWGKVWMLILWRIYFGHALCSLVRASSILNMLWRKSYHSVLLASCPAPVCCRHSPIHFSTKSTSAAVSCCEVCLWAAVQTCWASWKSPVVLFKNWIERKDNTYTSHNLCTLLLADNHQSIHCHTCSLWIFSPQSQTTKCNS